ncbi:MAG: nickel-dependent hydrogenase large subunit [Xanthobacteraceae bacterium]|nr:nickel-dependent hydrogenase large subunit [Xanthobacteraceae bacterium]
MTEAGGHIEIALDLVDGVAAAVGIVPRRLPPVAALVVGRPAAELIAVVPLLFSMCGTAHRIAAQTAVDAAQASKVAPELDRRRRAAVIAEHLAEQLRGIVMHLHLLDRHSVVGGLREIIRASATFAPAAGVPASELLRAIEQIEHALERIGLSARDVDFDDVPDGDPSDECGYLSSRHDREVIARLMAGGQTFARVPTLADGVPETGAWARRCVASSCDAPAARLCGGAAVRLKARIDEVAGLPDRLRGLVAGSHDVEPPVGDLIGYSLGDGWGASAVETARGRLYHCVQIGADGRVVRFEFLAPTEWNFHPRGPLVRELQGQSVGSDPAGRAAVERLIAAFDPCVDHRVTYREAAHA